MTNFAPAMIFLKDNALLERELRFDDVKPRLLGKQIVLTADRCLLMLLRSLGNLSGSDPVLCTPELLNQAE